MLTDRSLSDCSLSVTSSSSVFQVYTISVAVLSTQADAIATTTNLENLLVSVLIAACGVKANLSNLNLYFQNKLIRVCAMSAYTTPRLIIAIYIYSPTNILTTRRCQLASILSAVQGMQWLIVCL